MDPLLVLPKKLVLVLGTSAFFALVLASMTFAAPLRNTTTGLTIFKHETTLGPMVFGTEPPGRGTWGILFSCTTTYAFCVWTAVHPNVIPDASSGYRLFYKGVLMVISIINPEGIAVFAYGQLAAARDLKRQWEMDLEDMAVKKHWDDNMYETQKRKYSLNMQVAFFIVMGGFTIDESTEESNMHLRSKHIERLHKLHIINAPKEGGAKERKKSKFTATLTPAGFLKYANEGYFDERSFNELERMVRDKGKASNIAKFLSAAQALWLGVQCAARKAAGLPLRYVYYVPHF
jgi:hypothetical protein